MTDLITQFEFALKITNMSPLECAWCVGIETTEELKQIINGKRQPNATQTINIEKFIKGTYRKTGSILPDPQSNPS